MRVHGRDVLVLLFLVFLLETVSAQTTFMVPSTATPTIQSAIAAAASGDTILIAAGSYAENLVIAGKDLSIHGAGIDATLIDAGQSTGVTLLSGAGGNTVIRDLEILGGTPEAIHAGNGIDLSLFDVRIRNTIGSGLSGIAANDLVVEDSEFTGITGTVSGGGAIAGGTGSLIVRRSSFFANDFSASPGLTSGIIISNRGLPTPSMGPAIVEDCEICDNINARALSFTAMTTVRATRCRIERNSVDFGGVVSLRGDVGSKLEDSLVADNGIGSGPAVQIFAPAEIVRTSMAGNMESASALATMSATLTLQANPLNTLPSRVESTIIAGNADDDLEISFNDVVVIENCLLQAGFIVPAAGGVSANPTVNLVGTIIGLDAGFRDPAIGDHGLLSGSPAVDAGFLAITTPMNDLDGNPRIVGSHIDMGCFELQNQDPGAAFAGTTTTPDLLFFNGTSGGPTRSVTVDVSSICTLTVNALNPASISPFIIWGHLGVPRAADAFVIPFAGGSMAFLPHLLDLGNPQLFTFTNNLLAPNSGLIASTPAPWTVTGPCAPFPITMTLQGLIAESTGPLRITNAITLHSR